MSDTNEPPEVTVDGFPPEGVFRDVECSFCGESFENQSGLDMHHVRNRCPEVDHRSTREKIHDFLLWTVFAWLLTHVPPVKWAYRAYRRVRYGRY